MDNLMSFFAFHYPLDSSYVHIYGHCHYLSFLEPNSSLANTRASNYAITIAVICNTISVPIGTVFVLAVIHAQSNTNPNFGEPDSEFTLCHQFVSAKDISPVFGSDSCSAQHQLIEIFTFWINPIFGFNAFLFFLILQLFWWGFHFLYLLIVFFPI